MLTEQFFEDEIVEVVDNVQDLYLCFQIGEDHYAIDVTSIKEIIPVVPVTVVPHTEEYIKGIINLRGDIVPVISVRKRFGREEIAYDRNTCIIIVFSDEFEEESIGLIVDRVSGVVTIGAENISAHPETHLRHKNQFVSNIGRSTDGVRLLLELKKLLGTDKEEEQKI